MSNETQTSTPAPQTPTPNPVAASTGAHAAKNPVAANAEKFYPKSEVTQATDKATDSATQPNTTESKDVKGGQESSTLLTDKVSETAEVTEKKEGDTAKTVEPAKTEEKKDAEGKTVAPEKYELKLPENARLDKAAVDEIAAFAKAQGLSNEAAQEIVNRENKALSNFADGQMKQLEAKRGQWFNEIKADPELGGKYFEENAVLAKSVVDKFGDKVLKDELSKTGLGNFPALFKFMVATGKALNMQQEKMVNVGSQESVIKKSTEEKFYPKRK